MHKKHFLLGSMLIISALCAGVIALTPSASELQKQFEADASRVLATSVTSKTAQINYFPQPHMQVNDIVIANDYKIDVIKIKIGFLALLKQDVSKNPLTMQLHSENYSSHIVIDSPNAWQQGLGSQMTISLKGDGFDTKLKGTLQGLNAKLEANEVQIHGYKFNDVRLSLTPKAVILSEAKGYKGVFTGQITPDGNAEIRAKSVDILTFLPYLNISGQAQLEATGHFMKGETLPSNAKISLKMGAGNLHQGNLEETIREVVRRPLARSSTPLKVGNTPFTALNATLLWRGKWASEGDLTLTTANSRTVLQGEGAWNGRNLNFKGFATLIKEKLEIPFMVQGNYQEPLLRFDVQQLINQSKATAPLRSPARDEDAAKAVLDVINRTNPALAAPDELMKNISKHD